MEYRIFMSVCLPDFLCQMGCERSQKLYKGLNGLSVNAACLLGKLNEFIVVFHKTGDYCVQAEALQTLCDLKDKFVAQLHHIFCLGYACFQTVHSQLPETVQETVHAVDSSVIPLRIQFRRTYEQLVEAQGITAVVSYQVVRGNHIAFGFTHLNAVLTRNHSLIEQFLERFVKVNGSDIIQELGIETGIQKVENRMLHSADIHIYRQVFVCFFF